MSAPLDKLDLYAHSDYRLYLVAALGGENKRTGARSALARFLDCQTAYLSQVLAGKADLSLEQAYKVNLFLKQDQPEAEYFLTLVQWARAGSVDLKSYFATQLDKLRARRREIQSRVQQSRILNESDHVYYYNHWYVGAIHMALSVPGLQTVKALMDYFGLSENVTREVLGFLLATELAKFDGEFYQIGPTHIHLVKDSPHIHQLHANARIQALQSLDHRRETDLHYSVTYSLSAADAAKLRQLILEFIETMMQTVRPSKEEVLYCNTIDFFELKK